MCTGPFLICTLPHAGASDVISGPFEVRTLPDALDVCLEAFRGVHSPWCFGFGLDVPHTPTGAPGQQGGEDTRAAAAGEFPKMPLRVFFFFLGKSSCSILPPYKEGPVLLHSSPLWLDQGLSVSGYNTAQLSTLPSRRPRSSPCVYHTLSLFPSLPAQATRFLSVLLKPCSAGEKAVSSALS